MRQLAEVADAAMAVFADKGYRGAGISDVSAALGLSHGALYTYVDSKQALLYLALLRGVQPEAVNDLAVPVLAPPPQELEALLESWISSETSFPDVETSAGPAPRLDDLELGEIIDALYGFIERNRRVLELLGQSAAELPELAKWYFVQRRRATLEHLGDYLRARIRSGELRPVPDIPTAARFIMETIAWFAMHRHGDPDSAMLDDDTSRRSVRHLLLAAFLPVASDAGARSTQLETEIPEQGV
jgi:AcrR family transcriptional regulator